MNEIPPIITERVDDIPLLLEQMQRMSLPSLLDDHFPTHGNWQGLSLGWVATIWLSSILSRGDHRLVHVEPWVGNRLWTLRATTGQAVERLDFTDDRLEIVLHSLHDDTRWTACEAALNRHTVRVYELPTARVHVDSTSASGYTTVSENGLFQFGHSKDYRPDLPQVKVMQAVLDPLGMPLATDVVSGERADDPLYVPCIRRVQESLGRHGLLYVGDCTMASRETRAFLAAQGDCSRDSGFDMDGAGDRFYTTGPKLFFQRSQRCSDRVNTCQTPRRALSTSRTSQNTTWDFIAVTISKPPAHDVAISLLATHPASALCPTLATYAPVARLTSW